MLNVLSAGLEKTTTGKTKLKQGYPVLLKSDVAEKFKYIYTVYEYY